MTSRLLWLLTLLLWPLNHRNCIVPNHKKSLENMQLVPQQHDSKLWPPKLLHQPKDASMSRYWLPKTKQPWPLWAKAGLNKHSLMTKTMTCRNSAPRIKLHQDDLQWGHWGNHCFKTWFSLYFLYYSFEFHHKLCVSLTRLLVSAFENLCNVEQCLWQK